MIQAKMRWLPIVTMFVFGAGNAAVAADITVKMTGFRKSDRTRPRLPLEGPRWIPEEPGKGCGYQEGTN